MTKIQSVTSRSFLRAHAAAFTAMFSLLGPAAGCSLVGRVAPAGLPSSKASTSSNNSTSANVPNAASADRESSPSNAVATTASNPAAASSSSSSPAANAAPNALAAFEQKFGLLLKQEARYSVAIAHRMPSVCQAQADRVVSKLWMLESNNNGIDLTCFPLKSQDVKNTGDWRDIRDVQDHGALGSVLDNVNVEADGYAITVQHGGIFAVKPGPLATVAFFPLLGKPTGSHGDVFATFDDVVDSANVTVDILTSDAASAASTDLAGARAEITTQAVTAIKARGAAYLGKEAAALAKVNFPKAARSDAALVKLVKEYLQTQQAKTGVDPALVKKIIVTSSDWAIRKNQNGLILGKTADVTVGFARANKTCAFTTLVVQRDYAGGGTYSSVSYLNGFQSGFEKILCERI